MEKTEQAHLALPIPRPGTTRDLSLSELRSLAGYTTDDHATFQCNPKVAVRQWSDDTLFVSESSIPADIGFVKGTVRTMKGPALGHASQMIAQYPVPVFPHFA
ncbi:hypothetical protein P792_03375 [Asaia sp. SF2.1]|nr:hypothetical protein [Asaia sp. SF2.1]ETC99489.1 hypothetical protein P792_03375 [Asaia sp. SF2.1]